MKNSKYPFTSNMNPDFTAIDSFGNESEYNTYEEARADYPNEIIYYLDDEGNKRDADTNTTLDE